MSAIWKRVTKAAVALTAVGLCLGGAARLDASPPAPVAFTGAGSGAIQSERINGATARFEIFPESQILTGSLAGTHDYNEPEIAIVNFVTLKGTYHASADFVGTINGVPCTAVINQNGQIDFTGLTFEGQWVIISSTCGAHGHGTVSGQLAFTGEFTYNVTTSWSGSVN